MPTVLMTRGDGDGQRRHAHCVDGVGSRVAARLLINCLFIAMQVKRRVPRLVRLPGQQLATWSRYPPLPSPRCVGRASRGNRLQMIIGLVCPDT
jgi:hypothetical protein